MVLGNVNRSSTCYQFPGAHGVHTENNLFMHRVMRKRKSRYQQEWGEGKRQRKKKSDDKSLVS